MKKTYKIVFIIFFTIINAYSQVDKKASNFTLKNANNKTVNLSDFKGKIVLIDFWSTWCKPCIEQFQYTKTIQEDFGESNVVIINIAIDDDIESWKELMGKKKIEGVHLFAGNQTEKLKELYKINTLPHYVLVDKNGNIVENNNIRPNSPRLKEYLANN